MSSLTRVRFHKPVTRPAWETSVCSSELGEFTFYPTKPNNTVALGAVWIVAANHNVIIRDALSRHLSATFRLEMYGTAREVFSRLSSSGDTLPDVVILDVDLDDMAGISAVATLRCHFPATKIPIITTGKYGDSDRLVKCLHEGAQDYIHTPVRRDELIIRVNTQISLAGAARAETEMAILRCILPSHVISRMGAGARRIADSHENVTVMFADLCGFTDMCSAVSAEDVVEFLNGLYTALDRIVDANGVYKVDVIGDAYMVVSGHDSASKETHASNVLNFALDILEVLHTTLLPADLGPARMRIGIHSGPAVAGVLGEKTPHYTFLGDTVNVASRMESHGGPMAVHLSAAAYSQLIGEGWDGADFECAGRTRVKGKGTMITYFAKAGEYEEALEARRETDVPYIRAMSDHESGTLAHSSRRRSIENRHTRGDALSTQLSGAPVGWVTIATSTISRRTSVPSSSAWSEDLSGGGKIELPASFLGEP